MKCPFRVCEVHDVCNSSVTTVHMQYENCYGVECPYWGTVEKWDGEYENGCRKIENELGHDCN